MGAPQCGADTQVCPYELNENRSNFLQSREGGRRTDFSLCHLCPQSRGCAINLTPSPSWRKVGRASSGE